MPCARSIRAIRMLGPSEIGELRSDEVPAVMSDFGKRPASPAAIPKLGLVSNGSFRKP